MDNISSCMIMTWSARYCLGPTTLSCWSSLQVELSSLPTDCLHLYTMGIPLGTFREQMSLLLIPSKCLTTPLRDVPWATHSTVSLGEVVWSYRTPAVQRTYPSLILGSTCCLQKGTVLATRSSRDSVLGMEPGGREAIQGWLRIWRTRQVEEEDRGVEDLLVERVVVVHGCWGCGVGPPPDCHLGTGRHPWWGCC